MDWSGVKFPTTVTGGSITNFEKNNNIDVAVVGYKNDKYVPVRPPGGQYKRVTPLFYFSDGEKSHYACIRKSGSRLLRSSFSKHSESVCICWYCFSSVPEGRLKEHKRLCSKHEPTQVTMPVEGSVFRFRNYQNMIRSPVVIYADFETLHQRMDERYGQTRLVSKHIPAAYSVVVVSDLPEFQM